MYCLNDVLFVWFIVLLIIYSCQNKNMIIVYNSWITITTRENQLIVLLKWHLDKYVIVISLYAINIFSFSCR